MKCFYHENNEVIKYCIHCNKAICNECFHSEYPEYCWSCGLDYDNSVGNAEKSFRFPMFFYNKYIFYILHKLFSAFGSCLTFTILMTVLFGLLGANELNSIPIFIGLLTSVLVYTYGITISLLIDFAARYIKSFRFWYIEGGFYLFFGLITPFFVNQNISSGQLTISICGGLVSLIFYGLQKINNKNLIILFGLLSIIPIIIIITLFKLIKALSYYMIISN